MNGRSTGSISSQYKQIGNAVPIKMAYHIGKCLISRLAAKEQYCVETLPNFQSEFSDQELTQFTIPGWEMSH